MTDLLIIASPDLQVQVLPTLEKMLVKEGLTHQVLAPQSCEDRSAHAWPSVGCMVVLDDELDIEDSWWPESAVRVISRHHRLAASALVTQGGTGTRSTRMSKSAQRPAAPVWVSFGADAPTQPGDFGVMHQDGLEWLVRAWPAPEPTKRRPQETAQPLQIQALMPVAALGALRELPTPWVVGVLAGAVSAGAALSTSLRVLSAARSSQVVSA